jgi:hypothetical protein
MALPSVQELIFGTVVHYHQAVPFCTISSVSTIFNSILEVVFCEAVQHLLQLRLELF